MRQAKAMKRTTESLTVHYVYNLKNVAVIVKKLCHQLRSPIKSYGTKIDSPFLVSPFAVRQL